MICSVCNWTHDHVHTHTKYPNEATAVLMARRAGLRIEHDQYGTRAVRGSGKVLRLADAGAQGWLWMEES